MNLFEKICMGIVVAPLSVLLIEGALFVREARIDADKITGEAAGWNRGVWNVLGDTSAAMLVVAQIGAKERNDFDAQQTYYKNLSSKSGALLDSLTSSVDAFNNTVLPRVAAALDGTTALETTAAQDLADTTMKIDASIDSLTSGTREMIDGGIKATTAAAAAMSDPAIHETLVHVDGVAGNLDATSGDVRTFVHRETTPVRGTWNEVKAFLAWIAGPLAQVATAAK
jgi:hypothetical protein